MVKVLTVKKILIISLILGLPALSSCSNGITDFNPESEVRLKTVTVYPEIPPINIPSKPNIDPWEYNLPRNNDEIVVKNISSCQNTPESERDDAFWKRCGTNPIVYDPEIRACLSPEEFKKMQIAFQQIENYTKQLRNRLEKVNEQRERWIKQNKQNKEGQESQENQKD